MPRSRSSALQTLALLVIVIFAAVALLALVGGPAFLLPTAGWAALVMIAFIGIQLALFRLFGLRSRADEEPDEPEDSAPGDPDAKGDNQDWRAWRG